MTHLSSHFPELKIRVRFKFKLLFLTGQNSQKHHLLANFFAEKSFPKVGCIWNYKESWIWIRT